MKILRPYQEDTVARLAKGGLNASGLGAGKTLTSVEACRLLQLGRPPRVLVVAPVTTLRQWSAAFAEQYPSLESKDLIRIVGTHRKDVDGWARMTSKKPGVYILSWNAMHGGIPEWIRRDVSHGRNARAANPKATMASVRKAIKEGWVGPWTRTGQWDLLIIDEAHRASNRNGVPFHVLKLIKAERRLALTATPGSKPEGLWAILHLLWPDRYGSFWQWAERHFVVTAEKKYGVENPIKRIGPEVRPGGVWSDIPAAVRYRTEEVCPQLPSVIERTVYLAMAPEQEEQYRDFEEQAFAWLSDVPVGTPLSVEQRTRLRQAALGTLKASEGQRNKTILVDPEELAEVLAGPGACKVLGPDVDPNSNKVRVSVTVDSLDLSYEENAEQIKLAAVRDILSDLPDDEPLLVWTHSAKWARMAEKALGKQAVSWTMSTTAAKRKKIEAGFGKEWRVLIAQSQSLSEGVDWLKNACRCEVVASVTEDEIINQQMEGRLHRPGQTAPVQRWRLIAERTIEDSIYWNNAMKRTRMEDIYSGRRSQAG